MLLQKNDQIETRCPRSWKLLIGGGLAKVDGLVFPSGGGEPRDAREVLTLFAHETSFQLLARAEIGASILVAPGVKVRVSGGFDWPGTTVVTIFEFVRIVEQRVLCSVQMEYWRRIVDGQQQGGAGGGVYNPMPGIERW